MFLQFEIAKNLPSYLPCNRFFQGSPSIPFLDFQSFDEKLSKSRNYFFSASRMDFECLSFLTASLCT